jgi:hypothetical protein
MTLKHDRMSFPTGLSYLTGCLFIQYSQTWQVIFSSMTLIPDRLSFHTVLSNMTGCLFIHDSYTWQPVCPNMSLIHDRFFSDRTLVRNTMRKNEWIKQEGWEELRYGAFIYCILYCTALKPDIKSRKIKGGQIPPEWEWPESHFSG